jgi:hypothetical protein
MTGLMQFIDRPCLAENAEAQMVTKAKNRTAPAFTSSDALLFDYIRKIELRLVRLERYVTVPKSRRQGAGARLGRRARCPSRRDRRSV